MIAANTVIAEVACSWCGGAADAVTGVTAGALVKTRCNNMLQNGKKCGSWTTASPNATYLLKLNYLAEVEAQNDNQENTKQADEISDKSTFSEEVAQSDSEKTAENSQSEESGARSCEEETASNDNSDTGTSGQSVNDNGPDTGDTGAESGKRQSFVDGLFAS